MHSYPTPELVRAEPMSQHFTKFHLDNGRVLHRFSAPDTGPPHNHPWGFTSHVLAGGYVEDVYTILEDGSYWVERFERLPGTSHQVLASTIHRLLSLPTGECWTLVEPGPWEQKSGFYDFRPDGVFFRYWDEPDFRPL